MVRCTRWCAEGCVFRLRIMDDVVALDRVSRIYRSGTSPVIGLDEVSLGVGTAVFVAVMGATGSGKSTLLHCAAGLEPPSAGTARLAGPAPRRSRAGAQRQRWPARGSAGVARCPPLSTRWGASTGALPPAPAGRPATTRS